jgi:hypothetical protein
VIHLAVMRPYHSGIVAGVCGRQPQSTRQEVLLRRAGWSFCRPSVAWLLAFFLMLHLDRISATETTHKVRSTQVQKFHRIWRDYWAPFVALQASPMAADLSGMSVNLSVSERTGIGLQYVVGEAVKLWVNKVGPYNNPQETYNYYYLPFCSPGGNTKPMQKWGGLGEVLQGNQLIDSQLEIKYRSARPLLSAVALIGQKCSIPTVPTKFKG